MLGAEIYLWHYQN